MKKVLAVFSLSLCTIVSAQIPSDYVPDLSKSDIYMSYLKRTPLSGWWKINKVSSDRKDTPDDKGTAEKYYSPSFDDSAWTKDLVPGNINAPFLSPAPTKEERTWGGVIWYRKDFTAPQMKAGERAILHFNEVVGAFKLFINGNAVSEKPFIFANYHGPVEQHDIDITQYLKAGKDNLIAIRLFHDGNPVQWGYGAILGINGLVYLDIKPLAWTDRILVTPQENLKDVEFECILSGSDKSNDTNNWTSEIFEWKSGKKVATAKFSTPSAKNGVVSISASASIPDAKLWSCESPFLYGVKILNAKGELCGIQRFGMRTFIAKNGNFLLNGKPVMLRGITMEHFINQKNHSYSFATAANPDDFNRKYWQQYKDLNINHVRLHSHEQPPSVYDIFDELGFIITDEIGYPTVRLLNPEKADEIDIKNVDNVCDKNGKLLPQFIIKSENRIRRLYSHPCICTYSFGNEIRTYTGQIGAMLNNIYDLYTSLDKQNRPKTTSSGRFWKDGSNVEELFKADKLTYIDTHDYTGSINNFPLPYCQPVAEAFVKKVKSVYGENAPPLVNGETVYFSPHYHKGVMDPLWASEDAVEPNWPKMLYMLNEWKEKDPDNSFLGLYWVRNWGSKNYKYHRDLGRGVYTEKILEIQRKLWPDMDGFEALSEPFFIIPKSAFPFDKVSFEKTESYPYLQKVCSPVIGILDYIAPNRFTNTTVNSNAYVINNSESDKNAVSMIIELKQNKQTLLSRQISFGKLERAEKKKIPFTLELPDKTGDYTLDYTVYSENQILNNRSISLRLRNAENLFKPLSSDKKIALFDSSAAFGSLKPFSTAKLLKHFKVNFESIKDFKQLKNYDLLIIGNNSVDAPEIQAEAELIRNYAEEGGRILVFDQTYTGRIPFLQELAYALAGPGQFTEILRFKHPMMRDMDQKDFFCWNQNDWCIYRTYITPVSEAAITTGGDTTQWGADHFGMINAHLKLGKGDLMFSQAETTQSYKNDAAAAQLARNMIETMLDDRTRANAANYKGHPDSHVKAISDASVFPISIAPAANMAFADPVAGDKQGGWTDQGPKNDLAGFPLGVQRFAGSKFDITDPMKNGGKSCVVVSANKAFAFPQSSPPIPVNKKLKRIIFLHAGAWMSGKNVGEYKITFKSGQTTVIPLINNVNIGDWWNAPTQKLSEADCAWSLSNASGVVGLFAYEWKNPRADFDEVTSISLSASGNAVIGLAGITAEINR